MACAEVHGAKQPGAWLRRQGGWYGALGRGGSNGKQGTLLTGAPNGEMKAWDYVFQTKGSHIHVRAERGILAREASVAIIQGRE